MNTKTLFTVSVILLIVGSVAWAGQIWDNNSMFDSPHPKPVEMTGDIGNWTIRLEDDSILYCHDVYDEPLIMRCDWQDAYWWINSNGVIYGQNDRGMSPMASSDLQAWSITLSQPNE